MADISSIQDVEGQKYAGKMHQNRDRDDGEQTVHAPISTILSIFFSKFHNKSFGALFLSLRGAYARFCSIMGHNALQPATERGLY